MFHRALLPVNVSHLCPKALFLQLHGAFLKLGVEVLTHAHEQVASTFQWAVGPFVVN